jgi:hypothetical protein
MNFSPGVSDQGWLSISHSIFEESEKTAHRVGAIKGSILFYLTWGLLLNH